MAYSFSSRWRQPALLLSLLASLATACRKDPEPAGGGNGGNTGGGTGGGGTPTAPSQVAVWLTAADQSVLFTRQRVSLQFAANTNSYPTIQVDTTQTFQTMDGFGYSLTGGSAQVMSRMSAASRAALIKELFATDSTSLGVSYLRVSIGASDLNEQPYTYDDVPAGQTDPTLTNFSLNPDLTYVVPVLREILAVNPNIKILGSPWTAPPWMKQGADSNVPYRGGSLRPQYYDTYARYLARYVQDMKALGVTIDAITLQNEPLNPYNNPSMTMSAQEQATFIKANVGPVFQAAGLTTKIICYDHNCDRPDYPTTVLSDPGAYPYVDGSAFHLYGGTIDALTTVHNAFPQKNVYFTEQWTQAPGSFATDLTSHVRDLEIGAPRNWSRNVLEWNLASDQNYGPYTAGGCTQCLGAVTINGSTVTRNPAYYTVGHSSKFVRPGAVRVASNVPTGLPNVAYKLPNGRRCLVVLNTGAAQTFNIQYRGKVVTTSLNPGSVATYIW